MDQIISSLNRIEGQVRGIKKMYQEERECEKIAQQISAIQSALTSVGKQLLTEEALKCMKKNGSRKEMEKVISSAMKIG